MEKTLDFMFAETTTPVRTIFKNSEIWFVLSDVCKVLELSSPHKVADRLEEDEKGRSQIPTPGGTQEMTIINESGLYSVILRSDKPQAKVFRRWVTHEVLPSIRKQGYYSAISDDDLIAILTEKRNNDPKYLTKIKLSQQEQKTAKTIIVTNKLNELIERIPEMDSGEFDKAVSALFSEGLTSTQYSHAMKRYNQYQKRIAEMKRERMEIPSYLLHK